MLHFMNGVFRLMFLHYYSVWRCMDRGGHGQEALEKAKQNWNRWA